MTTNSDTNLIEGITERMAHEMSFKIDRYVKLHIQPKPRYLPDFIWKRILKRLLVLEEFNNLTSKEK